MKAIRISQNGGPEVLALDQLHREVQLAIGLSEVEDLDDVTMREFHRDPSLVHQRAD